MAYSIGRCLGEGGFGTVHLVTDNERRKHAMKTMKNVTGGNRQAVLREINVHKKVCKHDNIVKIIAAFRKEQSIIIILEYCELGNLNDYIVKNKGSTIESFRKGFMLDMAQGVSFLHDKGIAHCDLKPANVLLAQRKQARPTCKLADFGLAKTIGEAAYLTSDVCGTKAYMAPEVFLGIYHNSCDIFSLGMIFYVLFSLETSPQIDGIEFNTAGDQKVQEKVKAILPEEYADLVSKMISFNAAERGDIYLVLMALWK